jgi:metal-responsive CopG/Arc/MetJ family transcriptional regulator
MKTAISLPDDTLERVDRAAKQLGISRSEFFARAAERWLAVLEDDQTTAAINSALAGLPYDTACTDAAAAAVARSSFVDRLCGGPAPDLDEIRGIRHSTRRP